MQMFTAIIEAGVVAVATILADRWLSTKWAVVVLCVGLLLLSYLRRKELQPIYEYCLNWSVGNRAVAIFGFCLVGALFGLAIGYWATSGKIRQNFDQFSDIDLLAQARIAIQSLRAPAFRWQGIETDVNKGTEDFVAGHKRGGNTPLTADEEQAYRATREALKDKDWDALKPTFSETIWLVCQLRPVLIKRINNSIWPNKKYPPDDPNIAVAFERLKIGSYSHRDLADATENFERLTAIFDENILPSARH
jgi:hypothetical protein